MRILIVDDNSGVRNAIAAILKDWDRQVEIFHAFNGQVAVDKASTDDFDLILMDLSMPVMDGITATAAIIAIKPQQKIVGVSMHTDKEDISSMRKAGVVGYVYKDQIADKIVEMLRVVLAGDMFFPED